MLFAESHIVENKIVGPKIFEKLVYEKFGCLYW
jgi:hypothetical protein